MPSRSEVAEQQLTDLATYIATRDQLESSDAAHMGEDEGRRQSAIGVNHRCAADRESLADAYFELAGKLFPPKDGVQVVTSAWRRATQGRIDLSEFSYDLAMSFILAGFMNGIGRVDAAIEQHRRRSIQPNGSGIRRAQ